MLLLLYNSGFSEDSCTCAAACTAPQAKRVLQDRSRPKCVLDAKWRMLLDALGVS